MVLSFQTEILLSFYNRKNENESKELFEGMNKYHSNIILTAEVNLSQFRDTKVSRCSDEIKRFKYHTEMKLPLNWASGRYLR